MDYSLQFMFYVLDDEHNTFLGTCGSTQGTEYVMFHLPVAFQLGIRVKFYSCCVISSSLSLPVSVRSDVGRLAGVNTRLSCK